MVQKSNRGGRRRGAGRPPLADGGHTTRHTVTLDQGDLVVLRRMMRHRGHCWNLSAAIRLAIDEVRNWCLLGDGDPNRFQAGKTGP